VLLADRPFSGPAASEIRLDEIARHASTLRTARRLGNVRTSEL
jgi:hypothetical protein